MPCRDPYKDDYLKKEIALLTAIACQLSYILVDKGGVKPEDWNEKESGVSFKEYTKWWREHQKKDEERKWRERIEKQENRERRTALSKLTSRERKLLKLKV